MCYIYIYIYIEKDTFLLLATFLKNFYSMMMSIYIYIYIYIIYIYICIYKRILEIITGND